MNTLILSIGSNALDKAEQMEAATTWLCERFNSVRCSEVYTSPSYSGKTADYMNMVAVVRTRISLCECEMICKEYEMSCGRTPQSKLTGVIPIDIDIMTINGMVLRPDEFHRPYFMRGLNNLIDSQKYNQ